MLGQLSYDVVVVGAGLAGMNTAWLLADHGLNVLVLEARDRVGGRTHTRDVAGSTFDVGGQWIGPSQPRLAALAAKLGVATHPTWHHGRKVIRIAGKRSTYGADIPSISLPNLVELQLMLKRIERLAAQVDPKRPWKTGNAATLDAATVESWKQRTVFGKSARAMVDLLIRSVWSAEPGELSMLYLLHYAQSAGGLERLFQVDDGAQQAVFVGGAQQLSEGLAEAFGGTIRLEEPVRKIAYSDHAVSVSTEAATYQASRLVVAIPPVLAGRIAYEPGLPVARDQLTQRMPMGATIKCLATYDTPFWRADGLSGEALSHDGVVSFVYDNTSTDGTQPCLVAFVTGDRARNLSGRGDSAIQAAVVDDLTGLIGPGARHPREFIAFDWSAETWSGGCPVGLAAPGLLTSTGPALRQPVGPIHWAGTETASQWCGYMEGALQSGERAAREVIAALAR